MSDRSFSSIAAVAGVLCMPALAVADDVQFEAPVRLQAGGEFVKVEMPGYASPAFVDMDQDGHGDLVVGQFAGGKLRVFRGSAGGFQSGSWLEADGAVAQVPGVW